jgi:hypothetical protein
MGHFPHAEDRGTPLLFASLCIHNVYAANYTFGFPEFQEKDLDLKPLDCLLLWDVPGGEHFGQLNVLDIYLSPLSMGIYLFYNTIFLILIWILIKVPSPIESLANRSLLVLLSVLGSTNTVLSDSCSYHHLF